MTIFAVLIGFIIGGLAVTVHDVFSSSKESYLYVFNRETKAWDRASLLDLKLTLCNDLKVFDKEN